MWIASKLGYFSIVQKPPGKWHVRARLKRDLDTLVAAALPDGFPIHRWDDADYRWRIIIENPHHLVDVYMALMASVTYPDFKAEIGKHIDQRDKLPAYHQFWADLVKLQEADRKARGPG
jgi:hypothetical protein